MPTERIDVTAGDRTVSVSNPGKIYFPDLGERGRKIDVVGYYAAVAEVALRPVAGRPTYLQRFPDGITGEDVKWFAEEHPEVLDYAAERGVSIEDAIIELVNGGLSHRPAEVTP